jgi:hypothetical protein
MYAWNGLENFQSITQEHSLMSAMLAVDNIACGIAAFIVAFWGVPEAIAIVMFIRLLIDLSKGAFLLRLHQLIGLNGGFQAFYQLFPVLALEIMVIMTMLRALRQEKSDAAKSAQITPMMQNPQQPL